MKVNEHLYVKKEHIYGIRTAYDDTEDKWYVFVLMDNGDIYTEGKYNTELEAVKRLSELYAEIDDRFIITNDSITIRL